MALNKYMNPRNIYKSPPDFGKLSKNYPEFASISKVDVTGKVTIDFKDPQCLRILTKCLLKSDFNLDVDIPDDRLVPTLPLRLNYVLWVEDLLKAIERDCDVRGLDIGTGACVIYPLLAVVKNKWQMVGTETDEESFSKARENIERNNLQDLISLIKNNTTSIFDHIFTSNPEQKYDFTMCNPPFYSNIQELCESRSTARPPPKNGFTGSPHELITEGGELEFCRKMINESKNHKNNVIIFTTMVGHKFNLKELLEDLKAEGVKYTNTEFCQGRVTRWGLAWTYQNHDIYKLVPPRNKPRKKNLCTTYQLPDLTESANNDESVQDKIRSILQQLKITYKILNKKGNSISFDIIATENTWSNQRRKRRLMKRQESDMKRQESDESKKTKLDTSDKEFSVDINAVKEKVIPQTMPDVVSSCSKVDFREFKKNSVIETASGSDEKQHFVHAFLKLFKKEANFFIETDFLDGSSGKEGLHQIIQFIKNNWK